MLLAQVSTPVTDLAMGGGLGWLAGFRISGCFFQDEILSQEKKNTLYLILLCDDRKIWHLAKVLLRGWGCWYKEF